MSKCFHPDPGGSFTGTDGIVRCGLSAGAKKEYYKNDLGMAFWRTRCPAGHSVDTGAGALTIPYYGGFWPA